MNPDFNKVAKIYDLLSGAVFGDQLMKAQISALHFIQPQSQILIVGGGTGKILEEIAKVHASGLTICYVEISKSMIDIAKKKNHKENIVHFFQMPIQEFYPRTPFGLVITPFFFDLFNKENITQLFSHIDSMTETDATWLYTDFIPEKLHDSWWQKLLLKAMYLFFSLVSRVEAQALTDMNDYFKDKYQQISEQRFYGNFIRTIVYKKTIGQ